MIEANGKRLTGDILAVVDAAMDGPKSATCNDGFNDELGGVNLPLLALPSGGGGGRPRRGGGDGGGGGGGGGVIFMILPLVLLHRPRPVQMSLQLLVQALQVDLIRPHKPIAAFLHFFSSFPMRPTLFST